MPAKSEQDVEFEGNVGAYHRVAARRLDAIFFKIDNMDEKQSKPIIVDMLVYAGTLAKKIKCNYKKNTLVLELEDKEYNIDDVKDWDIHILLHTLTELMSEANLSPVQAFKSDSVYENALEAWQNTKR